LIEKHGRNERIHKANEFNAKLSLEKRSVSFLVSYLPIVSVM